MMLEYHAADNVLAGVQAEQAIEGAARYALAVLTDWDEPGEVPDTSDYLNQAVDILPADNTVETEGRLLQNGQVFGREGKE